MFETKFKAPIRKDAANFAQGKSGCSKSGYSKSGYSKSGYSKSGNTLWEFSLNGLGGPLKEKPRLRSRQKNHIRCSKFF